MLFLQHDPHAVAERPPDAPSDSIPPTAASPASASGLGRVALAALAALGLVAGVGSLPRSAAPRAGEPPLLAVAPEAPPPPYLPVRAASTVPEDAPEPTTLDDQIERLLGRLRVELRLSDVQVARVQAVFDASPVLSQGNPVLTEHPMSRAECRRIRAEAALGPTDVPRCSAPNMVPVFDPDAGQTPETASVCIDQFEFPNIPCEYPVVHVRANESAELCRAVGKRLCDAHEWEGACAGALHDPSVEYAWDKDRMQAEHAHNRDREMVWSYGPSKNHARCGTNSRRTPDCPGGGWNKCGSNTYPAGAFPACQSSFGAFDLHGNVAEHMNLPMSAAELGKNGSGVTEMKGSWFVFSTIEAHQDDCRWRAPAWHESRVDNPNSHRNYHLGFRCCKDVE